MSTKIENFIKPQLKTDLPDIRPGDTVKVYQKIKEKIQVFEGLVLAKKHGQGITSTITVRRVIDGIGVEKVFPIHSPTIEKIEILKRGKVRRAKLYYLRKAKGKKARLKKKDVGEKRPLIPEENTAEEIQPEEKVETTEAESK